VEILAWLLVIAAAYLIGSIPSGYLAGIARGIDIRKEGSGNIGATNAFRILGKTAGTIVLVADGLKGWFATAIVPGLVVSMVSHDHAFETEWMHIVAGVVVILGHNYTVWLNFKGGKGIATSAGVLAALVPWTLVIALSSWILVLLLTRYVSVASITAAFLLPIATWAVRYAGVQYSPTMIGITALMGGLAIYKHKANIQRLMNGTENKIGKAKLPAATKEGA
jgi:glycerol-3-phosphate acyltransferase PlsY